MITWFDVPKEGMSPGSKAIIPTGKITITENGTDIDVSTYATADVNVEGGGGSSDFSTAEVTISGLTSAGGYFIAPYIYYDGEEYLSRGDTTVDGTYQIILYKGNAFVYVDTEGSVAYDGNIEEISEGLLVTGDGTITIS